MRVILLSAEYPPREGGVGDYTRRLALALCGEGQEVSILTSAGTSGAPGDPLQVYPRVANWGWGCLPAISRHLHECRPAVLHLQYQTGAYGMHPAIHFLPEVLRCLPAPLRLVVTMHDLRLPYLFPKAGRLRHLLVAHLLRQADAVVVTNGADLLRLGGELTPTPVPSSSRGRGVRPARDLLHPLPPGALRRPPSLIPLGSGLPPDLPGYDRAAVRARVGVGPEEALLGHFGLLHPSKGADLLVEALGRLRPAGRTSTGSVQRPARLLLVGGGVGETDPGNVSFREELRALIGRLGVGEAVLRTGVCSDVEAAGYLRACDLVVLPYRDGASFRRSSLVAALSLGCPVVTTAPLDPEEVSLGAGQAALQDGANVFLVPRGDATALAAAIAGLLEDSSRRKGLGEGAGRLGEAFRWEGIARQTLSLYADLAGVQGH